MPGGKAANELRNLTHMNNRRLNISIPTNPVIWGFFVFQKVKSCLCVVGITKVSLV